jgi:hypothetical protein
MAKASKAVRKFLAQIGAKGGRQKSARKAEAARANARKRWEKERDGR